jgi:RNA polymerase sigma-70 factor, ECF subfamily
MPGTETIAKPTAGDAVSAELADLIGKVAQGDRKAFRRLYDLVHRRLFGVALLLVHNREAAEDVLQDAFIRIWTRAGTFDPDKGVPMAWLARIVRNGALDRVRRKVVLTDDLEDHQQVASEPPVSVFAVAELNKCLAALAPGHRAAWWMIYLDGLSREEVATRMRLPLGTIKTWVFRSSRQIRAAIER